MGRRESAEQKDSVMRRVMATNAIGYTEEEKEYPIAGGYLTMDLSPVGEMYCAWIRNSKTGE